MDQAPSTTSLSAPDPAALAATRRRLHGIGECLMAGPQRRAGGRFTLRVTPGYFATTGQPALRLDGTDVVVDESRRVAVAGKFSELDETSYGSSPGDGFHAMPYAYVSTGNHDDSDFWNAPFGAVRSHEQMRSVDDLVTFWRKAQSLLKPHV